LHLAQRIGVTNLPSSRFFPDNLCGLSLPLNACQSVIEDPGELRRFIL
jgi:hypothetical protein